MGDDWLLATTDFVNHHQTVLSLKKDFLTIYHRNLADDNQLLDNKGEDGNFYQIACIAKVKSEHGKKHTISIYFTKDGEMGLDPQPISTVKLVNGLLTYAFSGTQMDSK